MNFPQRLELDEVCRRLAALENLMEASRTEVLVLQRTLPSTTSAIGMNPEYRRLIEEVHRHAAVVLKDVSDLIEADTTALLRLLSGKTRAEDVSAVLKKLDLNIERAERLTIDTKILARSARSRAGTAAAVRLLSSLQKRKTPAATGVDSKATRAGDAHEHSE
jgi:hypothetical protein